MVITKNKRNLILEAEVRRIEVPRGNIQNFEIENKSRNIGIDKQYKGETAIRRMICGENIIDGQVVKRIDGLIFVARSSDNETELNLIQGVAIQSGFAGEYIDVLLYGLGRVPQRLDDGLLFLGLDGFLKNEPEVNVVEIGYKVGDEILVYQKKDVIIFEV